MVVKFPPGVQHRRFTIADYHRMIDLAILPENLPVELIDGELAVKAERRSAPYRGTARIERYPFSPEEVRRLRAAGLLSPTDMVERRDVEEWRPMSIGIPHCACVDLVNFTLMLALATVARVRIQNPVVLDTTEPEPDASVVRHRADNYRTGKPEAVDVYLIVEVADTTLDYDRDVKGPTYARNGIPEYWIVDLNSNTILVHRDPRPDGTWADVATRRRGDTLEVAALPGVTIAVADILP
jgi:hypothetical protein